MTTIHPIPPGLWCVPSAIVAITGEPFDAVVHPALNRHSYKASTLTGLVTGATTSAALAALEELGWHARRYRGEASECAWVRTWASRYPSHTVLLMTAYHALVTTAGRVWDNHAPHGPPAASHPFARTRVEQAYLVQKRQR